MSTLTYAKSADGATVLVLDGEPVALDAPVTLGSGDLAAALQSFYQAGAEATARALEESWKTVEDAWPEMVATQAEAIAAKVREATAPQPVPFRISSMPARTTTRNVERDERGLIVRIVDVEADLA